MKKEYAGQAKVGREIEKKVKQAQRPPTKSQLKAKKLKELWYRLKLIKKNK